MPKCIFNKKSHIKGYRRCEITGQIMKGECYFYNYRKYPCKYFKSSLFDRFLKWLTNKF